MRPRTPPPDRPLPAHLRRGRTHRAGSDERGRLTPIRPPPPIALFTPLRERLFRRALARALSGCRSVLDLGCGAESPLARLRWTGFAVGVDVSATALAAARRTRVHAALVQLDAVDASRAFRARSVDAVLALDVIEHLDRTAALELLDAAARIARRRVVVLTPNGFLAQPPAPDNPHQAHRSGFTAAEMRALGYRVRGMYGLRPLLGPFGEVRWRPAAAWRRAADATAPLVYRAPALAFAVLCVREIPSSSVPARPA